MTGNLRVDTSVLASSGDRLIAQASTLSGANASTVAASTGAYGHSSVEHAVGQFAQRWATGLTALGTDLHDAGTALGGVATTFEQVDARAASAARQMLR